MTETTPEPDARAGSEPVLVTLPDGMPCYTPPERFELFSEIEFIHAEIFTEHTYLRHGIELPRRIPACSPVSASAGKAPAQPPTQHSTPSPIGVTGPTRHHTSPAQQVDLTSTNLDQP